MAVLAAALSAISTKPKPYPNSMQEYTTLEHSAGETVKESLEDTRAIV